MYSEYDDTFFGQKTLNVLIIGYVFLSYFEYYIQAFTGSITKYYILLFAFVLLYNNHWKVNLNIYVKSYFLWFLYKFLSVYWSNMTNTDVSSHFVSQVGIVILLMALLGGRQFKSQIDSFIKANYWCSFAFAILSIVFRASYISEDFVARQVLTLFGRQNDPNNCAAFLSVGFALAIFSLVIERKQLVINSVVSVTCLYAILLTASRAGFLAVGCIIAVVLFFPKSGDKVKITDLIVKLIIFIIIGYIGVVVISQYLPQASLDRVFNLGQYEAASGRQDRWKAALQLWGERPIFGWGWGGYQLPQALHGGIHNTILDNLCDVGIVGTLFWLIPIIYLLVYSFKNKDALTLLILWVGVFAAIGIDAINKRFLWNSIYGAAMMELYHRETNCYLSVFKNDSKDEEEEEEFL